MVTRQVYRCLLSTEMNNKSEILFSPTHIIDQCQKTLYTFCITFLNRLDRNVRSCGLFVYCFKITRIKTVNIVGKYCDAVGRKDMESNQREKIS